MNNPDTMTQQESLLIIQQMINTAKAEQKDDGRGWILWGWLLFAASVLTLINLYFNWFQTFFFWNFFGLITILLAIYETVVKFSQSKKAQVKTYTKVIFRKLNIGFFIALMTTIVAMNVGISPLRGFPLLMNLYAFWILIYAAVLDFKPSMIGAYIMWVLAIVALFIPTILARLELDEADSFKWIMTLHAIGVMCGYIIPGYLANRAFKKATGRKTFNASAGV